MRVIGLSSARQACLRLQCSVLYDIRVPRGRASHPRKEDLRKFGFGRADDIDVEGATTWQLAPHLDTQIASGGPATILEVYFGGEMIV
jgi:hypothetical protein